MHENPVDLSLDEERWVLERGLEALERTVGVRPVGYRSPGADNSVHTIELLLEYGFEYYSSLSGSDYEPYWCRVGDRWPKTEPYEFGQPVPIVEMPFSWHLNDFVYFQFALKPLASPGFAPPSTVLEIWKGEFDYLYRRVGEGVLIVTMHPQVSGRGHLQEMLRRFIDYVTGHDGVTFTPCRDYSRMWRSRESRASLPTSAST